MDSDQAALQKLIDNIQSLFETGNKDDKSDGEMKLFHMFENARTETPGLFEHLKTLTLNSTLSDMTEDFILSMENLHVVILTLCTISGKLQLADPSIKKAAEKATALTKTAFSGVNGMEEATKAFLPIVNKYAKKIHENITSDAQVETKDKVTIIRQSIQAFREYCIQD